MYQALNESATLKPQVFGLRYWAEYVAQIIDGPVHSDRCSIYFILQTYCGLLFVMLLTFQFLLRTYCGDDMYGGAKNQQEASTKHHHKKL